MAQSRGSGFRTTRGVSQRRKSSWEIGVQTGTDGSLQTITASSAITGSGALSIVDDGLTLVRTRGFMNLFLTAASGVGEGFTGAVGICRTTLAAVAVGVTAIPTPITEESWDGWLWHRYFSCFSAGVIAAAAALDNGLVHPNSASLNIEVDSKAMRKTANLDAIVLVLECTEVGTATMRWSMNTRMLFKLP